MTESAPNPPAGAASSGPAVAPTEQASEPVPREQVDQSELEDRWRRAVADLDNLRKRYAREVSRERSAERARVAAAFLPVVDSMDLALEHASADPGAIVDGVRAMHEQALAVLGGLGYRREDETGVPFDPGRHEVVGVVDADRAAAPPGSVVAVLRPGYGGPEQHLRPAAVTVAQRPAD